MATDRVALENAWLRMKVVRLEGRLAVADRIIEKVPRRSSGDHAPPTNEQRETVVTSTLDLLEDLRSPTALGKLLGVSRQRAHQLLQSRKPKDVTRLAAMLESIAAQLRDGEAEVTTVDVSEVPAIGTPITIRGAARRYGMSPNTVWNWTFKYGWVSVIERGDGPGSRTLIDEHDVARVVAENKARGNFGQGKRTQPAEVSAIAS